MVQVSYHTHIPEYIPKYTWKGLVGPMWRVIRFNILMADLTLVPSKTMKVSIQSAAVVSCQQICPLPMHECWCYTASSHNACSTIVSRQRLLVRQESSTTANG